MRRALIGGWIAALAVAAWSCAAASGPVLEQMRLSEKGDERVRAVFELSAAPEHELFTLSDPERVVVDLADTALELDSLPRGGLVRRIRTGRQGDGTLRVVLDLKKAADTRSFVIGPGGGRGHRLVVDLLPQDGDGRRVVHSAADRERRVVVAIDAGHGGVDPGAIGANGTHEKDVVLAVARRLASILEDKPHLKPVLIREGDYYIGLRDRTRKADRQGADIFLSLHADASESSRVDGASVYALSLDGASSEQARMLARQGNAPDFISEISLQGRDPELQTVLLELSRGSTIETSLEMGNHLLTKLDLHADLLHGRVHQAGFAVLKSLDMPSVLIELGFITNPREERRLKDPNYQYKLAAGIASGVSEYARENLLPDLRQASGSREHVVHRGETLSGIARRYDVSTEKLRSANDLSGDRINAGAKLTIP